MAHKTLHNALKAPVRPAPPPPSITGMTKAHSSPGVTGSVPELSRPSQPPPASADPRKKKTAPPPRPPPPKASAQLRAVHNAIVFTEMLQPTKHQNSLLLGSSQTAPDLLINWESPPTSPTPGRSSSDGLSLKSFGSDSSGTTGTSGFTGGPHGARSESGFESEPDAWTVNEPVTAVPRSSSAVLTESVKPFSMPTIIRPNRSGNKALPPPPSTASGTSTHLKALEKVKALPPTVQFSLGGSSSHLADLLDLDASDPSWTTTGSDEPQDYSPPEPCIPPPPAPPVFIFTEASPPPPLAKPEPSAEALYDYASGHPGDLNFKEGDRILLKAQVNEEWLRGSLNSVEGLFPASYVRILVPLQGESCPSSPVQDGSYRAIALYSFAAETDQDLSLEEGDLVEVRESLGNGWLYGRHCQSGRVGQFPESFVQSQ